MKKILLFSLFLTSCTVYTEKQSEAVSQSVYATQDAINDARIDLADQYINEVTKLIKPPKHPIKIDAVYEDEQTTTVVKKRNPHKTMRLSSHRSIIVECENTKKRVVILPESYKNDKIVSVNSTEYNELLKNKKIAQQLQEDNKTLVSEKQAVTDELKKQNDMTNKMIKDLNYYQKEVYKLRLGILWRDIILAVIALLIGLYIYVKASKPIPFL
jgi:hypothetical protein